MWLDEWFRNYIQPSSKIKTCERYSEIIEKHLKVKLGEYELDELTPLVLQRYVTELLRSGNIITGKGLAANSVNGIITVIQNSLKLAYTLGELKEYTADKIRRPKTKEKEVSCFSLAEQKKIEQAALSNKKRKFIGIVICLYSGLRIGELLALTWSDIDFTKGTLAVNKTCHDGRDEKGNLCRITDLPKTASSKRMIPLPKQLLPVLKEYKRKSISEYVVESENGEPPTVRSYQRTFELLQKRLHIERKGFHSLRHTFATRALECGMDVKTLAEILGHKNATVTLNRYAHSLMEHKQDSTFDLSKGGSVTINSVCYNFYGIYDIKLGAGTKAEYGTKDQQSTNDSDAYYYGAEFNDDLKIIRFVYGAGAGTATTSDVKVEGMKGYAIEESEFTVTLAGDTFTEIAQNTDVTSWFKNMPLGLVAKIKTKVEAGATSLTIAISGTPQSVETVRAYIEIPEQYLAVGEYDITIDPNKNKVDFSIVSGETIEVPVPSVTQFDYDGEEKVLLTDGEGYTVSNNKKTDAGEYTAVVTLKKGYKWSDGTTDPINIPWTIKRQDITIDVTLAKTTYEYTGYTIEPEYTVYRITPTGNIVLPRSEYKGELSNNKDVGTATLTVEDNGIGNYNITNPVTVNFEIVKGTKTPPTGLKGIAPSADGATDGKITGTTADMEYSTDTEFTSPIPCTDTETTGLAEGTYYVRYKETGTSEPSDYAEVKVALNSVTVVGGTGGGKYAVGASVTVKVTVPTGKTFASWTFRGVVLNTAQITQQEITFTMPENDVVLTALFNDINYDITVTDGTASAPTAKYQEEVTVTANAPGDDEYFDKWEVTGITLSDEDLAKSTLTFQMPAGDVTFKATYLTIEKFDIVVVDGTKDKEVAKAGEIVTITAGTKEGKVFDKWTCETAGVTIEFANATSSTTTFVMPASNIKIQAHFRAVDDKPSVEIKVEGGTGAGTYKEGDSVTITANDPAEGKVFKGWQDASGKIVSTEKSYTFTVNGETTLTAVYEDESSGGGEITPPAKKDGLSGGQIAGIVIGSVAVAGIGGFAIFWFAVKKKTFADLGVALKKGFTAIGNFFKNLGAKIKALFTKKK